MYSRGHVIRTKSGHISEPSSVVNTFCTVQGSPREWPQGEPLLYMYCTLHWNQLYVFICKRHSINNCLCHLEDYPIPKHTAFLFLVDTTRYLFQCSRYNRPIHCWWILSPLHPQVLERNLCLVWMIFDYYLLMTIVSHNDLHYANEQFVDFWTLY